MNTRTDTLMQMLLDPIAPRALGAYHAVVGLVLLLASVLFGALYQMLGPLVVLGGMALALRAVPFLPPASAVGSR